MNMKVIGSKGSPYARVGGQVVPCVHAHWVTGKPMRYSDPDWCDTPRWSKFVEAIRTQGTVVLTRDKVEDGHFERAGYIGLYAVNDVRVEDDCLRFTFTARLG